MNQPRDSPMEDSMDRDSLEIVLSTHLSESVLMRQAYEIFLSLRDKRLFDILCCLSVSKTFPGPDFHDVETYQWSVGVTGSSERLKGTALAECFARLKIKNPPVFWDFLIRLCKKRFHSGQSWDFRSFSLRKNKYSLIKMNALPFLSYLLSHTRVPENENDRRLITVVRDLGGYVGGTVGSTGCVETEPEDRIVYAYRLGDQQFPDRFVLGRNRHHTSLVHLSVRYTNLGYFSLLRLGFGGLNPPIPHKDNPLYYLLDEVGKQRSREFWRRHAFVYNENIVRSRAVSYYPLPGWDA